LHYWPTVMSEAELMWGSSCFSKLTFKFRRCKEFWSSWSLVHSVERLDLGTDPSQDLYLCVHTEMP
jgi:hypothetical protein